MDNCANYQLKTICTNCGDCCDTIIVKGLKVSDVTCDHCGCLGVLVRVPTVTLTFPHLRKE